MSSFLVTLCKNNIFAKTPISFISGPALPSISDSLYAGQMVSSPDGKGVIGAMGPSLVEFRSGAAEWTNKRQSLKYGRTMPVMFAIPNDLTSCGT